MLRLAILLCIGMLIACEKEETPSEETSKEDEKDDSSKEDTKKEETSQKSPHIIFILADDLVIYPLYNIYKI